VVKDGDLVTATHGRSFWILDNVALLHQLDDQATSASTHLFTPRKTIRFRQRASLTSGFSAGSFGSGDNPPNGVVVPYYFKEQPTGEVTLTFSDSTGKVIQSFSNEKEASAPPPSFYSRGGGDRKAAAEAGANSFVWNMRYPPADVIPDAVFQGSADGPLAPPGTYSVELSAAGQTTSQTFEIVRDPRIGYADADLKKQFDFLIAVRDELTETMNVVRKIRELRGKAEEAVQKAGGGEKLEEALKALNNKLYPLEERLVQYRARAGQDLINYPTATDSKLARLMSFASMADAPPTQGARNLLKRMSDGVDERAAALEEVESKEYAELMKLAGSE